MKNKLAPKTLLIIELETLSPSTKLKNLMTTSRARNKE
jgi:hypothetical protein